MLHPVGDKPTSVYWRRRLVVLLVLVALLAGAGWLVVSFAGRAGTDAPTGAGSSSSRPAATPALERVLPPLADVRTPGQAPATPLPDVRPSPSVRTTSSSTPAEGRCTDDVLEVAVQAPARVPTGSKPTLEVVVRNVGRVPCVRSVDQELLEILLLDAAGKRVWGSNDCFPEQSDRTVTLRPRGAATLPVVWGGLTSAPGCAGERTAPPAGDYVLRARLDTKTSTDRPIRLG